MTDLFDVPLSLSPRRAWLERHGLTLTKLPSGRWECALDEFNRHRGDDEDEACIEFCLKTGIKHWNTA